MSSIVKPSGYSPFSEEELTELVRGIDPETAKVVDWWYAQVLDPYGIDPDLPEDCECVGRDYFVQSLPRDIWVWFGDLPSELSDKLWAKHKHELAFPAGLELDDYKRWKSKDSDGFDGADAAPLAEAFKEAMADERVQKHLSQRELTAAFAAAFNRLLKLENLTFDTRNPALCGEFVRFFYRQPAVRDLWL
jgi:hypothetical protein